MLLCMISWVLLDATSLSNHSLINLGNVYKEVAMLVAITYLYVGSHIE
jgi:hypothetical protein